MKKTMAIFTLLISLSSLNAHALEAIGATYGAASLFVTTAGVLTTMGKECGTIVVCKEAAQVVQDTQNYIESGEMTAFLNQKIKDIQYADESLSTEEAVDILVSDSLAVLNINN